MLGYFFTDDLSYGLADDIYDASDIKGMPTATLERNFTSLNAFEGGVVFGYDTSDNEENIAVFWNTNLIPEIPQPTFVFC